MTRTQKIIFFAILGGAAILLTFRLGRPDLLGDDGHYALRSVGYFDFLGSLEQTTPVQWFGHQPFWSYLSFHDHPPLFFLVQHIFFWLFGVSVVVSRLPSAFAALGSVVVLFFLGKRLGGVKTGLWAMGALTVNSYFMWMGRIGLLESVFTFFLLLGILFLIKALQDSPKHFLLAGLFFGLAFLSKYTILFVLPAILVYLLWKARFVFREKRFWLGLLIFLLVASPVLVYNVSMYASRGHFDVQFGDLFGQHHQDWTKLQDRVSGSHFALVPVLGTLVTGFSWPYFLFAFFSILAVAYLAREREVLYLVVLIVVFFLLFFSLVGSAARWLGVFSPFAALFVALALDEFFSRPFGLAAKISLASAVAALASFSLFYTLNTNHFHRAVGDKYLYANFRVENEGYNQLDRKISQLLSGKRSPASIQEAVRRWWYNNLDPKAIQFASLNQGGSDFQSAVIFDSNTTWFATIWIFERWKIYHRFFVPNTEEFLKILRSDPDYEVLRSLNLDGIYFIRSATQIAATSGINFPETKILVDNFRKQNIQPETIYDDKGRAAFYIYHGSFR